MAELDISKFIADSSFIPSFTNYIKSVKELFTDNEDRFNKAKEIILKNKKISEQLSPFIFYKRTNDFDDAGFDVANYSEKIKKINKIISLGFADFKSSADYAELDKFFDLINTIDIDHVYDDYFMLIQAIHYLIKKDTSVLAHREIFEKYLTSLQNVQFTNGDIKQIFNSAHNLISNVEGSTKAETVNSIPNNIISNKEVISDFSKALKGIADISSKFLGVDKYNVFKQNYIDALDNIKLDLSLQDFIVKHSIKPDLIKNNFTKFKTVSDIIINTNDYMELIKYITNNDKLNITNSVSYIPKLNTFIQKDFTATVNYLLAINNELYTLILCDEYLTTISKSNDKKAVNKQYSFLNNSIPSIEKSGIKLNITKDYFDKVKKSMKISNDSNFSVKESLLLEAGIDKAGLLGGSKFEDIAKNSIKESGLNFDEILQSHPNIKTEAYAKLNMDALARDYFEAKTIVNNALDKEGKPTKNSIELNNVLEYGIRTINTLMNKVIDTTKATNDMTSKATKLDDTTKQALEGKTKAFDGERLEKLGCSEAIGGINAKFNNQSLYLFNVNIKGIANKNNCFMALSPVKDYIEEHNGSKSFWYKCFGFYDLVKDEATGNQVVKKIKVFSEITSNGKLISQESEDGFECYVSFSSQKPKEAKSASKIIPLFIFSKAGGVYAKSTIYKAFDDIKDYFSKGLKKTKTNTLKKYMEIANVLDIAVQARYLVDKNKIKEIYTNINIADITNDKGLEVARANYDKEIDFINTQKYDSE